MGAVGVYLTTNERLSERKALAVVSAIVKVAWVVGVALCAGLAGAQKKVLDHSVYDDWKSIRSVSLSDDGKWFACVIAPQEGDAVLQVKATDGSKTMTLDRVSTYRFSGDSKFIVATVIPKLADTKKARRDKVKPEDMPKNSLVVLNLSSGDKFEREKISSFTMADEDKGWIVYRPEPPKAEPPKPGDTKPAEAKPAETKAAEQKPDDKPKKKVDHRPGDTYVLRRLSTGKEASLEFVSSLKFSKSGEVLVLALSTKDGAGDGVVVRNLVADTSVALPTQLGRYTKITVSDKGDLVAYQTDKDDYAAKKPSGSVYVWDAKTGNARLVAKEGIAGMPLGWWIPDTGTMRFSKSGARLILSAQPKPAEEKKDETPEEDKVSVDVWSWTDPLMMPQQLLQAAAERSKTYDALVNLATNTFVQLETPMIPSVQIANEDDGIIGVGTSNLPYRKEISWGLSYSDVYFVDLNTGNADRILTKFEGNVFQSPGGRYVFGWEDPTRDLFSIDTATRKRRSIGGGLPNPIWNEEFDNPDYPPLYGFGGFTENDEDLLVYDRYDIWKVDPAGVRKPVQVTSGRTSRNVYRRVPTDLEERFVPATFLASVTSDATKASGFHRVSLDGRSDQRLIWGDKRFTFSAKAKRADRWAITRQDFVEYPDVWLTNASMQDPVKVTDANPQQKDFNWGKAELVSWRSNDGVELQGILIKPENFDYAKKYPLIAYFYERDSDTLHQYRAPAPSASTINLPMYASNGYLVFIPDIPYKEGYPGESAVSAITSGVNSIVARGYVDTAHMGIQGQSWGGYQVGYLVTETNMFRAACAGAPVADMVSAYDGIRWGSGVLRQMQYERGQSRIAGTLWEKPLRYLENSPIFHVDKVQTPLLIMSNDKDGAVPWYQGIEYFSAMRRLNKPCWLVVYNNEDHNLVERKNRKDWSIRMQQFFDYYLKGAPMPRWMAEGIPATEKGKTYGFELTKGGGR